MSIRAARPGPGTGPAWPGKLRAGPGPALLPVGPCRASPRAAPTAQARARGPISCRASPRSTGLHRARAARRPSLCQLPCRHGAIRARREKGRGVSAGRRRRSRRGGSRASLHARQCRCSSAAGLQQIRAGCRRAVSPRSQRPTAGVAPARERGEQRRWRRGARAAPRPLMSLRPPLPAVGASRGSGKGDEGRAGEGRWSRRRVGEVAVAGGHGSGQPPTGSGGQRGCGVLC